MARPRKSQKTDYPWWLETLAAIGVVALLAGLITLFSSAGRRPGKIWATQAPAVGSEEFLSAISGVVGAPLRTGGTVELLNNGQFFPSLLEAVRAAKHTVNFSAYIWEDGKASEQVLAAFVAAARAGVQVRVLWDPLESTCRHASLSIL